MPTLAQRAVDALNAAFGVHPGFRAAHAKGTLCAGTFVATPDAARLTRAAHMQGATVPVTVRFSNSPGDPTRSDGRPGARGMAVKFYLPDGSRTDIVTITARCFFARTPEEFVKIMHAARPGILRMLRVGFLYLTNRRAMKELGKGLKRAPVPSYANCRYDAIHAFKWVASDGAERWVRYAWLPDAGEASIDKREAAARGHDYLQQEIGERMAREPVRFTLVLQFAAPEDDVNDPAVAWPEERDTLIAGTLELTGLDHERESADDVLVFDPVRVVDGIELPAGDALLHFRRPAYEVSVERRTGGTRFAPEAPESAESRGLSRSRGAG